MSSNTKPNDRDTATGVNPNEKEFDGSIREALDKLLSVLSDETNMQQVKLDQAST